NGAGDSGFAKSSFNQELIIGVIFRNQDGKFQRSHLLTLISKTVTARRNSQWEPRPCMIESGCGRVPPESSHRRLARLGCAIFDPNGHWDDSKNMGGGVLC